MAKIVIIIEDVLDDASGAEGVSLACDEHMCSKCTDDPTRAEGAAMAALDSVRSYIKRTNEQQSDKWYN